MRFEWDDRKNEQNIRKHGVSFGEAQFAFLDAALKLRMDEEHSTQKEKRYFGYGRVGDRVLTVRFTMRGQAIRIIGAGYWVLGCMSYPST